MTVQIPIVCWSVIRGFLIPFDEARHSCLELVKARKLTGLKWLDKYKPHASCKHLYCFYVALSRGYVELVDYFLSKGPRYIPLGGFLNGLAHPKLRYKLIKYIQGNVWLAPQDKKDKCSYLYLYKNKISRLRDTVAREKFLKAIESPKVEIDTLYVDDGDFFRAILSRTSPRKCYTDNIQLYDEYKDNPDVQITLLSNSGIISEGDESGAEADCEFTRNMIRSLYISKKYAELETLLSTHTLVRKYFDFNNIFVRIRCVKDIDICVSSLQAGSFTLFPNEFEPAFVSRVKNPKVYKFLNPFIKLYLKEGYVVEPFHISHIPTIKVFSYLDQLFRRHFGRYSIHNYRKRDKCKIRKNLQNTYNIYVKIIRENFEFIPPRDRYLSLSLINRRNSVEIIDNTITTLSARKATQMVIRYFNSHVVYTIKERDKQYKVYWEYIRNWILKTFNFASRLKSMVVEHLNEAPDCYSTVKICPRQYSNVVWANVSWNVEIKLVQGRNRLYSPYYTYNFRANVKIRGEANSVEFPVNERTMLIPRISHFTQFDIVAERDGVLTCTKMCLPQMDNILWENVPRVVHYPFLYSDGGVIVMQN